MEEDKKIDWSNISNTTIKHNLVGLGHEHEALKDKIVKLSKKLEEIEKEYIMGTTILNERLKGV